MKPRLVFCSVCETKLVAWQTYFSGSKEQKNILYTKKAKETWPNCQRLSLLKIDSSVFGKCVYDSLHQIFATHATRKHWSVLNSVPKFLLDIHRALHNNSSESELPFYAILSEAFDHISQKLLLQKLDKNRVDDVLFGISFDYLYERKHFALFS